MTVRRDRTPYAERRPWVAPEGYGVPLDPVPGFYRHKLRSGAVAVGVRIFFGPPCDPDTGEEMDRAPRMQAHCNGRYVELDYVWPQCARQPIDAREYAYLSSIQAWGEQHAPSSPEANPTKPVNWLTASIEL